MHATKPNQGYYSEILEVVGCRPDEALMVGDNGADDIEPAANLGLFTYWIKLPEAELPEGVKPTAQGALEDLHAFPLVQAADVLRLDRDSVLHLRHTGGYSADPRLCHDGQGASFPSGDPGHGADDPRRRQHIRGDTPACTELAIAGDAQCHEQEAQGKLNV